MPRYVSPVGYKLLMGLCHIQLKILKFWHIEVSHCVNDNTILAKISHNTCYLINQGQVLLHWYLLPFLPTLLFHLIHFHADFTAVVNLKTSQSPPWILTLFYQMQILLSIEFSSLLHTVYENLQTIAILPVFQ